MRIVVLIPSEDYRDNAGARIRYGRIAPSLAAAGHQLVLADLNSFDPLTSGFAVALFSKCHDARSLMCARVLAARGVRVGVDLFDDYFSQVHDSRITRYRDWLAELVPMIDFLLCSTPAMAKVARLYRVDCPIHVMNDPMIRQATGKLTSILAQKKTAAVANRTIDLCWFGMGDNPHFRVGLTDLAAFGADLAEPSMLGYTVRLKVLTNRRALDADGLSLLSRLPVDVTLEEWSPAAEAASLNRATACVLPVNAQQFSSAKSLNRAVSALSAGCQVLALGYPLYAPLHSLIYRDIMAMVRDVSCGDTLLRAETLGSYTSLMETLASPEKEAKDLVGFLEVALAASRHTDKYEIPPMAVIHGSVTSGAVHKFATRLGALAVRGPLCTAKLDYDVFFSGRVGQRSLDMFISEGALVRLLPDAREKVRKVGTIANRTVWSVTSRGAPDEGNWSEAPLPLQIATYANLVRDMRRQIRSAFGPVEVILSESSRHPFSARAA
ncbi:MAG: hypothetical protein H0W92_01305 [Sphingomonas sp.]|nr:hypothetical protein [Sphingomonas sp.]